MQLGSKVNFRKHYQHTKIYGVITTFSSMVTNKQDVSISVELRLKRREGYLQAVHLNSESGFMMVS
jgi:hypothetical protein